VSPVSPVRLRVALVGLASVAALAVAEGGLLGGLLGGGGSIAVSYFASFIVAIGVLIFIHELGHFLVAKWTGVGVERFSLGFGPRLWAFR
jgi:peptidase M50-like protein